MNEPRHIVVLPVVHDDGQLVWRLPPKSIVPAPKGSYFSFHVFGSQKIRIISSWVHDAGRWDLLKRSR